MHALIIDTSTERGVFAFFQNGVLLYYKELPFGLQSSHFLLSDLATALKTTSINMRSLHYIAVGKGPGSYTGMRVGVVAAKTLSFACSVPLIGLSTLECFVPDLDGDFVTMIDAKISGVYMQAGKKIRESFTYQPASVCTLAETAAKSKNISLIVTPNAAHLKQKFAVTQPEWQPRWLEAAPNIERMNALARQKYAEGLFSLNGELELNYMRKTQAELEKEALRDCLKT